ncbi:MAG: sulfatase [Cytophagaceae bacterium SCN 52-12]|nr:MAG: sulfatase [Cytophagaceae bacterium SCN 52-12]
MIFRKELVVPLLVLVLTGGLAAARTAPNILWITIEDTSPEFIGCYGNPHAKTPVIDRLAAQGHRFLNAFSTGSVCSPSRTALITAVKTYQTGTAHHRSKVLLPDFIKGFPYYLRRNGYFTVNNRKTDYNIADEPSFIKEAWDESAASADWNHRKPGQPFFAVFNFEDSHQSRTMTFPYERYRKQVWEQLSGEERISEQDFEVPPFYRDSPAMRKQLARVYNSLSLTDRKIGLLLKKLEEDGLRDNTIIFFFSDHGEGMPRGKTNSIDFSYRVPFVIWFPPAYRHLSPWSNGGDTVPELTDFCDLGPTVLSLAGAEIPAHMSGRAIAGPAREKAPEYCFLSSDRSDNGTDLCRTVMDGRYVYTRNFMPFMPELRYIRYMEIGEIKQEMRKDFLAGRLNKDQERLFAARAPEMLFDLEKDPWELENLADSPAHRGIRDRMRKALEKELLTQRDIVFLPEYTMRRLPGGANPYEYRLDRKAYQLEPVWTAASLSGFTDRSTLKKQVGLLEKGDSLQRYWALTGLCSYPAEKIDRYRKQILAAAKDSYSPAAVLASWLGYHHWDDRSAEADLRAFCASSNPDLALLALNLLLYTPRKDPFVETVKEAYRQSGRFKDPYVIKAACQDFLGSLGLVPNTFEYAE